MNNAGIVDKHRPITECTDEWWDEIIAIDQSSLFYMMKDTIPHMMEAGKGSIINVSSIGGVFGTAVFLFRSKISSTGDDKECGHSAGTKWYPLQCCLPGTNTDTAQHTGKSR